jgi:hypothetical protein
MKKKLIPFVLLFLISTVSCEKNQELDEVKFKDFKVNLSNAKITSNPYLIVYDDIPSLLDKLDSAIDDFYADILDEKNNDPRITDVLANIKFYDGKAIVTEIYFLDASKEELINGLVFDETLGTYQQVNTFINWDIVLNGASCPSGYSQVGSCNNVNNPENCISNALNQYLSANLTGIGSCVDVNIKVGLINTRICGKNC